MLLDALKANYPNKTPSGKQWVLKHQHDIEQALQNGYTRLEIYTTLNAQNQMPIGYHAFNRHLRDMHIGQPPAQSDTQAPAPSHALPGDEPARAASSPPHLQQPEPGPRTAAPTRKPLERNVYALSNERLSGINVETES